MDVRNSQVMPQIRFRATATSMKEQIANCTLWGLSLPQRFSTSFSVFAESHLHVLYKNFQGAKNLLLDMPRNHFLQDWAIW